MYYGSLLKSENSIILSSERRLQSHTEGELKVCHMHIIYYSIIRSICLLN